MTVTAWTITGTVPLQPTENKKGQSHRLAFYLQLFVLLIWIEFQGDAVNAITHSGWLRTVIENMA